MINVKMYGHTQERSERSSTVIPNILQYREILLFKILLNKLAKHDILILL